MILMQKEQISYGNKMGYDLIILGGGPAGYHAGVKAGRAKLKTLLIEEKKVGGVCLNEGCIPTKAFLYCAKRKNGIIHGEKYGVYAQAVELNHQEVVARKDRIVSRLVAGVAAQLKAAKVEVITGRGKITGGNENGYKVDVDGTEYMAKNLLITTGSVPIIPSIPGLHEAINNRFALTSKEMLNIDNIPERLIIIGGGVIGLEMASYFNSVGSEVIVIEMLDTVGGGIDHDIEKILRRSLKRSGIKFKLGCKVVSVSKNKATYQNHNGEEETVDIDKILVSIGRHPAIEDVGIENIGVAVENGAIKINDGMMTNVTGIYAAGDINGRSMLAHTAYREAEVAVNNMLGIQDKMDYKAIPGVLYTDPEVAGVGETEESADLKGVAYKTIKIPMNYSGRYVAENSNGDGIAKLIIDTERNTLIGFHIIGSYASEIIFGPSMMIEMEIPIEKIIKTVFPHPTVSEIIREALLQFLHTDNK